MVNNDDLMALAQRKLYEAGIPAEKFEMFFGSDGTFVEAEWCGKKHRFTLSKEELAALPRAAKVVNGVDLNKGHEFADYQGQVCLARLVPHYGRGDRVLSLTGGSGCGLLLTKDMARALALLLLNWAVEDTLET